MKKRIVTFLLAVVMLCTMLPVFHTKVEATTYVTSGSNIDGATYSSVYGEKLNNIFQGKVSLFSNTSAKFALGSSLNNSQVYYVANAISGYQCYIYAQSVYYYLFGDIPYKGSGYKYWSNSEKVLSNQTTASYNLFANSGVGFGAYMRTTINTDGSYNDKGHSMIILAYDSDSITYLEGNADGRGLIRVTRKTWNEFNTDMLTSQGRRIGYIVQCKSAQQSSMVKTTYPAYGTIKITEACNPYTLPCNADTAKENGCVSTPLTDKKLTVGDEVTVNGIVLNIEDNYWYRVTLQDGTSAYVWSGRSKGMTSKNPYVSGSIVPDSFSGATALSGTVINGGVKLDTVWAEVYDASGKKVLSSDKVSVGTTSNYELYNTAVDNTLLFQNLKTYGNANYKLYIKGEITYSTLNTNNNLSTKTKQEVQLGTDTFRFTTSSSTSATYTITFMANGGTCSTSTLTVTAGKGIGTLPDASFGRMDFEGWYTKAYGGTKVTTSTVPTGNMTVWAHYSNPQYPQRLNFDPAGGVIPSPVLTGTINGVNMGRPAKSLVVFNQSGTTVNTNGYGAEIAVNDKGQVVKIRNYNDQNQLTVPDGGFVLSGHANWNETTGSHEGGYLLISDILKLDTAYIHLDYETGKVNVYDSYAGYLAATKRGAEYTTLGVLPVPVRDGFVFRGWTDSNGRLVDYYSGFSGINYYAEWDKETDLYPVATLEYNGHYYELYDYNVSWTKAKALCESMGGYLVTITDSAEQAKIATLITAGSRGMYRIGATDAASEDIWKWVSGEKFSYTNWDKNAPEPSGGNVENYANIIAIDNPPNKQVGEWLDDRDASYGTFYDISNTGFICEYNKLPECSHKYQSVVTKATCTKNGFTTHTCYLCGDSYVDSYATALGHTWQAATCTTPKTCTACGTTSGSANGHTWKNATCTSPKTCTTCGTTSGSANGHTWKAATCTTPKTCTTCGATSGSANGHTWKAATCTSPKTCTTCGATSGSANGHTWKNATCTTPKTCTTCGATTGSANGHTEVIDKAVAATCAKAGKTEGKHCSVCDTVIVAQQEISALGHNWKEATCDNPKICTRCKASSGRPAGHIYDNGVDGTCNVCTVNREDVEERVVVHMFRMYNPNTGEHFYTGSTEERDNLIAAGWQYEGIGFTFPANTGDPVHRLFQPSTGEHLYTMDEAEKNRLMAEGWNYEGIAFNSAYNTEAVQHRLHNPNASVGAYHFTFSEEEKQNLIAAGWEYQGIGWYSSWK